MRNPRIKRMGISIALAFFVIVTAMSAYAENQPVALTPVAKYGQLQVVRGQLCDAKGAPIQLKGVSTTGLQWGGRIVGNDAFTALAKDWNCDVIRLALYVGEGGYANNRGLKELVKKGVDLAIKLGVYVIIDWHVLTPGDPNDKIYSGATAFFTEMATAYGSTPNVLYEIMNEPNGKLSWPKDLKPYATAMVGTIRAIDPDNIILIGSGTWSQDVDFAAADPVQGTNLMYTVHFYAGTHGSTLRDKIEKALSSGAAIFCSEWGTSLSSGTGGTFIDLSEEWLAFLDDNKISWVNWSLTNRNETSATFKAFLQGKDERTGAAFTQKETPLVPQVVGEGGIKIWPADQLSVSGAYVRAKIKGIPIPTYDLPIVSWDFEDGLGAWAVAVDSPVKPTLSVAKAESQALAFDAAWPAPGAKDASSAAPRLKIADIVIGDASSMAFDLYLEAGKPFDKPFEVDPVLQYPTGAKTQFPPILFKYGEGTPVAGGLVKFRGAAPISVDPEAGFSSLVLVIAGNGTGYKGKVYLDDIVVVTTTNGDSNAIP